MADRSIQAERAAAPDASLPRVATALGVLIIALALLPLIVAFGSGWELLVLLLLLPGIISGAMMLAGARRYRRSPGAAALLFLIAAILGVIATDGGLLGLFRGVVPTLIVIAVTQLAPIALAVISFRALLRSRRAGRDDPS